MSHLETGRLIMEGWVSFASGLNKTRIKTFIELDFYVVVIVFFKKHISG